jgi:hypothetical protein
MEHNDNGLPGDLQEVAARLDEERPQLSPMQLDDITRTVRTRSHRPGPRKGNIMRSRLATVLVLSTGLVLGGTGVSLGVTALQSTDDAATAEYGAAQQSCGGDDDPCQAVLGESSTGGPGSGADAADQAASVSSGTLPFTGYLAVPAMILGLGLVIGGLVLRRFALRDDDLT